MATDKGTSSGKATTKRSSPENSERPAKSQNTDNGVGERAAPRASAPKRMSGSQVAGAAARQLLELTGKDAEGVTGLERTEDGWKVQVEVVEMRRIPSTTDVLALYEVDVDTQGHLQGYRRLRRYGRGDPGQG